MWTILCLPAPIYFFAIRDSALSWSLWEYVAMTAHVVFVIHTSASFVAILHNHSHVPLFKKNIPGSQILNNVWQSWLLGPLFGQSPDTYYCHHIKVRSCFAYLAFILMYVLHGVCSPLSAPFRCTT
jgi:hypothetical protein